MVHEARTEYRLLELLNPYGLPAVLPMTPGKRLCGPYGGRYCALAVNRVCSAPSGQKLNDRPRQGWLGAGSDR
jgi:hypothetical protein